MIIDPLMTIINSFVEYEEVLDFTYQFSKVFLAKYFESRRTQLSIKHKNVMVGNNTKKV